MPGSLQNNQIPDNYPTPWRDVSDRTPITAGGLTGDAGGCGHGVGKILSVREVNERDGAISAAFNPRYRRTFQVWTAHSLITAKTVLLADGLPRIGQRYSVTENDGTLVEDFNSVVVEKTVTMVERDNHILWTVDVSYDVEGSPIGKPPEVRWGFVTQSRAIDREWTDATDPINRRPSYNGKAIVNSAGDPFDPPLEIEEYRPEITISRFEAIFDLRRAANYQNSVNSDYVTIAGYLFDPFELRLSSITADRLAVGPGHYWKVTYVIQQRPGGWKTQVLDRGFRRLKTPGNPLSPKEPIIDRFTGATLTKPALLNGNGAELLQGQPPVFLDFKLYPERVFSMLLLDYNPNEFNDEVTGNYIGD